MCHSAVKETLTFNKSNIVFSVLFKYPPFISNYLEYYLDYCSDKIIIICTKTDLSVYQVSVVYSTQSQRKKSVKETHADKKYIPVQTAVY